MKKLLLIFALAGTVSAQEYMLPIGSNVDTRQMKFYLGIGNADTGGGYINRQVIYTPQSSKTLKVFLEEIVQEMAKEYSPLAGTENDTFVLAINSDIGPSVEDKFFKLQQFGNNWAVPPKVLEVKLHYGTSWVYQVKGVKEIRMRLFKNGRQIASSSTATPNDDYGFDLSPCSIGATQDALAREEVRVKSAYIVPSLWDGTWDYGEMDIIADTGDYAVINILNGFIVKYSTAEFLKSLRALEVLTQSQAPVLVANGPRISRIARVGNTTEITVSAEHSTSVNIEFSETLGGSWYSIPEYLQPLSLQTGSTTFTHTTDALSCFYRLRSADSSSPQ